MSSSSVVVAEGGAVGVTRDDDNLDNHFRDTVAGGDWLCDQDAVDYFVAHCTDEVVQLEHWGCPWSRKADGSINVRFFGGMTVQRTWFAADRSGFHILPHAIPVLNRRTRQARLFDGGQVSG
jgi:fumarate reductase flavoprotein subunit